MPDTKIRKSYRLSSRHMDLIRQVAEYQGGLTETRVIEWAVERLHSDVAFDRSKQGAKKNPKKSEVTS